MPPTKEVVIQTAVSNQLAGGLKGHAAFNLKLLFDVFVEAMEQFVDYSVQMHQQRRTIPYYVSPRGAKDFNVRIPEKLARRLQTMADEDGVSLRRLAYTALVLYAMNHKLIPPTGVVQSGVPQEFEDPKIVKLLRELRRKKRGTAG